MYGDPSLTALEPGARVNLVVLVSASDIHGSTLTTLWHSETCRCQGSFQTGEVLTMYGVQYSGCKGDTHYLCALTDTLIIPRPPVNGDSYRLIKDIGAGIGGMALGTLLLGGHCIASLDRNAIACATLRRQFDTVLEGDIACAAIRQQLHQVQSEHRCLVGASLSFKGFLSGLGSGSIGPTGFPLVPLLQFVWHSQASGLVLECDPQFLQHEEVQMTLRAFASKASYSFSQTVLDLSHQWASQRTRWWVVLLPIHLPGFRLHAWPHSGEPWLVKHVLAELPSWPLAEEQALEWTAEEQDAYDNPAYGGSDRTLVSTAPAPLVQHSWGNALQPCPCGCRQQPLSEECLRLLGLPGVGVPSTVTGAMRFLHPKEVGLLNGLLPTHPLPAGARTALCYVGQLTSPLQALWVQAYIMAWATEVFGGQCEAPLSSVQRYQQQLLTARQDFLLTKAQLSGGTISVQDTAGPRTISVDGPCTVQQLLSLEAASLAPGYKLLLCLEGRTLPPAAFLHPLPQGPCYTLVSAVKRARKVTVPTTTEPQGPTLTQCTAPDRALAPACNATPRGDSQVSVAPSEPPVLAVPASCAMELHLAPHGNDSCSDAALWCGLWQIIENSSTSPVLLLPPKVAAELERLSSATAQSWSPEGTPFFPAGQIVLAPFVHQDDWTLLTLRIGVTSISAEIFDGIPGRNTDYASRLATVLCAFAGRRLQTLSETTLWVQEDPHSCGAIVMAHASSLLSGTQAPHQLSDARCFLRAFPPLPSALLGRGGLSADQEKELKAILVNKGVPQSAVAERLKLAVAKLGAGPIAEALQSRNVWQSLKAIASRPGAASLKWVQPDELQAHIEQRAQERFGADISRAKAKKQKAPKRHFQAPLHVDPLQLLLAPGSFVSGSGSPLGQLAFNEVAAQATGVCFCTCAQASPFLTESRNLSVDPLALITTAGRAAPGNSELGAHICPKVSCHLRSHTGSYPCRWFSDPAWGRSSATCISRHCRSCIPFVCRVSLYRDECKVPWDQIASAPVRVLLQQVPEFQVCKNPACDQTCAAFHAAVDEIVDHLFLDVWARQWSKLSGGKTKAADAEVFQTFVRMPSSALPHVFLAPFPGLYVEPRAADGSEPHGAWAVVWLPGHTATQASHLLKITEKAVALTRLGNKFGLRTKEADEQAVFEALRPSHQFIKVRIVARYRLHPLPHGFQWHNLQQQLKQWQWNAKPLQPDRGDASGSAWIIGASGEPPAPALPLGSGDVLATKIKDIGQPRTAPSTVCASTRTKKALIYDDNDEESGPTDPWSGGRDPWSTNRPAASAPVPASSSTESASKFSQLEAGLKHDLKALVQSAFDERDAAGPPPGLSDQDQRIHALETAVSEMTHQSAKFETWFQGFGTKVADQATQLTTLQSTVEAQQVELGRVRSGVQQTVQASVAQLQSDLTTQMAAQLAGQMEQIEALLPYQPLFWAFEWAGIHATPFNLPAFLRIGALLYWVPQCPSRPADHPGPPSASDFCISTSNPSGLRSKEPHYIDWGVGVHCFAETQLSAVSLPGCRQHFRSCARADGRIARILSGAPAPLRVNSQWAGSWTGVLQVSDVPCSAHNVSWPLGLFETGRVLQAKHYHPAIPLLIATVYGYPQGPTWPNAQSSTDSMLCTLTKEVVFGSRGFRVICGDFNHDLECLQQCNLWKAQGWIEAQDLAHQLWNVAPRPTCKHATRRDFLWLSPEAASYCTSVSLRDWFANFSRATEHSLQGFLPDFPNGRPPSGCFGRGQRTQPQVSTCSPKPLKPSRPGEAAMCHDGLGAEVRRWFQQLRRLQSLLHAVRAASVAPSAQSYRLSLWQAICRARGFRGGFPRWWQTRPVQLIGSPASLPQGVPHADLARLLHDDFRCNYRRFEAWHLRRRAQVIDAKYDKSLAQLFRELRAPAPEQVDSLTFRREYAILAVAPTGDQLHLDRPPDLRGISTWTLDGEQVQPVAFDGDLCTLASPACAASCELEQVQTISSAADLHSEFVAYWAPHWQSHASETPSDWRGWARQDLLNLPLERTIELIAFLTSVEQGTNSWPSQMILGFVCLLCKGNGRTDTQGFRPICLYSIIYRTWSGIRSRQVLASLCTLVPEGQLGFLPGREAMELWYSVQVDIEHCCQTSTPLTGMSTDTRRCFNHLPRLPLLAMAKHVGVTSNAGFPEGCPLSPVAMALADWAFHAYMKAFARAVRALSFVDNLACTATSPAQLVKAAHLVNCFTDMLDLQLDPSKTYTWATTAPTRQALQTVVMTWILPGQPFALHGIAGCPIGDGQLIEPLSIAPDMTADPGFYQLWACARDLRRMAGKLPNFVGQWRQLMSLYDGRSLQGPFSKLVAVLSQVGWSILQPPWLLDHEGLRHNFLTVPQALLRRLLENAWLQFVARNHLHRKTMSDLDGLDPALLCADTSRLSALDNARLASVRSGAFLFGHMHSHYDLTKSGACALCGVPDTVEHRIRVCPANEALRAGHDWLWERWPTLPVALTHHLLPPANPHLPRFRLLLQHVTDTSGIFFCSGFGSGWQHLFSDGSCLEHQHADFALAGWGLVHAQHQAVVSCGPLPGLLQTVPRAELFAMISAAKWALHCGLPCIIWTDALNVANGVQALQAGQGLDDIADSDLWDLLAGLLDQLSPSRFLVRHTPSHLDTNLTEEPFEDWLAAYNGHADLLAGLANHNRPQLLVDTYKAALDNHEDVLRILRVLRSIFFGIADGPTSARSQQVALPPEPVEWIVRAPRTAPRHLELDEAFPLNWKQIVRSSGGVLPSEFTSEVCEFLLRQDRLSEEVHESTWLELVFALHHDSDIQCPVCDSEGNWIHARTLFFNLLRQQLPGGWVCFDGL
ncbi:unnamed protein product [Symbiodinium sp. CCMP2592]|nr:unnamed protein product [Symbiodinium sp. CCMP2592]